MAKIKPLAGYCLILPIDEDNQKTAGGLVLPEKAKEKPMKGKVVEVGTPIIHYDSEISEVDEYVYAREFCQVEKDDIVIFHRWSGQDVREGDKEYKLVQFKDIMGVYE